MKWWEKAICGIFGLFGHKPGMCRKEEPPPPPPPPPLPPPEPPRVDRPVHWERLKGVTAFALAMRDRKYVRELGHYLRDHGYTWVRVGGQTDGWRGFGVPYLHVGPEAGSSEWFKGLYEMLDELARIPEMWVQLIPSFTHKQDFGGDRQQAIEWHKQLIDWNVDVVAEGNFKNVFWEVFNEFVHPLAEHLKDEDALGLAGYLRGALAAYGIEQPICVSDHHGGKVNRNHWDARYPYIWRYPASDYYALHPPRNVERNGILLGGPTHEEYCEAVDRYNVHVLFDETACWATNKEIEEYGLVGKGTIINNGRGSEEKRWRMIQSERDKMMSTGPSGHYLFHSIWGMECTDLGKLP